MNNKRERIMLIENKTQIAVCSLLAVALTLVTAVGCRIDNNTGTSGSGIIEESLGSSSQQSDVQASHENEQEINISIYIAEDYDLSQYASFEEFDFSTDEYGNRLVLTTDTLIKNLRFIEIGWENAGDKFAFFEIRELHSVDKFLPERPLVISVSIPGIFPTVGFSFVDENGITHNYYIGMSGEDGSFGIGEI